VRTIWKKHKTRGMEENSRKDMEMEKKRSTKEDNVPGNGGAEKVFGSFLVI